MGDGKEIELPGDYIEKKKIPKILIVIEWTFQTTFVRVPYYSPQWFFCIFNSFAQ